MLFVSGKFHDDDIMRLAAFFSRHLKQNIFMNDPVHYKELIKKLHRIVKIDL